MDEIQYPFTAKGFALLVSTLNHNTTIMKNDIKWLKWGMASGLALLTKLAFF